jgi:CRP-like cAMP-binding protein
MTVKRSIKDLERQCKKEPDNLVVRLLLAAAYRETGRTNDAIPLYRSVADSYQRQGRRTQAVAVLKSLLEINPTDAEIKALMDAMDREVSAAAIGMAQLTPPPGIAQPVPLTSNQQPLEQERPSSQSGEHQLGGARRSSRAGIAARVLAEDVVVRELTPVRPPGVPSTTRAPGAQPSAQKTPPPPAPPGTVGAPTPTPIPSVPPPPARPAPSAIKTLASAVGAPTPRRPASDGRGSSPLYTPTPLPTPVPFHEGDQTGQHVRAPSKAAPTSDPDLGDEALTRVADDHRRPVTVETGPSTGEITSPEVDVAADLETRRVRRLTEEELGVVGKPPPTAPVPRVDPHEFEGETNPDAQPHRGHDEDEVTRSDPHMTAMPASELEGPTDVHGNPSRPKARPPTTVRAVPPRRTPPPVTTPRPPAPALRPPAPPPRPPAPPRPVGTPRPVPIAPAPAPHDDEETRVAGASDRGHLVGSGRPDTHDTDRLRDSGGITHDTGPMSRDEATDVRDEPPGRSSEPGMHRSRTFAAQSFSSTLDEMDPDGAAIDAPLDVFSMLPPDALAELGRRMVLRNFAAGDLVIREGDPGDACYVIADGEVRVLKNDPIAPEAGPVEVARLGPRALFGEFALLADRRRHATVQATQHLSVYEIPRALLRELAASFVGVGPALDQFYRQRLLHTLLRTAPFFSPLPEDYRARLLARFVPLRAESGEPIVREGQPAGGLYLIIIGAVEITRRVGKHRSVILASLREGAYFGEMSLLSGGPASATVVAAGAVELALLPPRDFYDIVAQHPQLWAAIRRQARTRAMENAKLLAGETGTS